MKYLNLMQGQTRRRRKLGWKKEIGISVKKKMDRDSRILGRI